MTSNSNEMDTSDRSTDGIHKKVKEASSATKIRGDDVSFAPSSLDEGDEDDLQHFSRARRHTSLIHVGGGWGRHGSSTRCYLCRMCCNKWIVALLSSIGIMIGFGYLGYQAGQSSQNDEGVTKGQEWVEWVEHSRDHFHWPVIHHSSSNKTAFAPQTQEQLLQTSNLIFHACNEHSLSTSSGRNACLSACHGRICCFEKESRYGSCIDEPYSYCYVYAACENALSDFGMSNTNVGLTNSGRLNEQDKLLLGDACSSDNIKSLQGIRDCNAFCMHHLCCFNGEGCGVAAASSVCGDYDACKVLVENVVKVIDSSSGGSNNNFSGSTVIRPTPTNTANGHDFIYHDPDTIRASVSAACTFDPLANDDSWVSGCHALCAEHLCCFGTPGTMSDCRQEPDIMCSAYAGCNVLLYQANDNVNHDDIKAKYEAHRPEMTPGSSETPDDIREVNEACNANVSTDSALRKRCEEACSSRQCCFINGPGNCYILVSRNERVKCVVPIAYLTNGLNLVILIGHGLVR